MLPEYMKECCQIIAKYFTEKQLTVYKQLAFHSAMAQKYSIL
jgi:hypothetical protein